MSRFKFSKRILTGKPNSDAINEINKDFESFIGTLGNENVSDESIRFRHLSEPGTLIAYNDCSEDLFKYGCKPNSTLSPDTGLLDIGTGSSFEVIRTSGGEADNKAKLFIRHDGNSPSAKAKVLEVTMLYYPYSSSAKTEIAPAYQPAGSFGWIIMTEESRTIGIKAGRSHMADTQPYCIESEYPSHPVLTGMPTVTSQYIGDPRKDSLASSAVAAPVTITFQVATRVSPGQSYSKPLSEIQAFGLSIKHHTDDDALLTADEADLAGQVYFKSRCCLRDKLVMYAVMRDL